MYKIKRFSIFGGLFRSSSSKSFSLDTSDISDVKSYNDLVSRYPKIKSADMDKLIRIQNQILKLNSDLWNLTKKREILFDEQFCPRYFDLSISNIRISDGTFIKETSKLRNEIGSNDYISLNFNGEGYLIYEISTGLFYFKYLNYKLDRKSTEWFRFNKISDWIRFQVEWMEETSHEIDYVGNGPVPMEIHRTMYKIIDLVNK